MSYVGGNYIFLKTSKQHDFFTESHSLKKSFENFGGQKMRWCVCGKFSTIESQIQEFIKLQAFQGKVAKKDEFSY